MRDGSGSATGTTAGQARVLAGHARFLITVAARAPSVHNTQPWRFRAGPEVVDLWTDPAGRLPQRDFDLGRGIACLPSGGAPPSATAVLLTPGDRRADWLRAGQALYRLLLHAASQRVFASLHTQPLEDAVTRDLISSQLALPGHPPDAAPARPRYHRVPDRPAAARRTRQPLTRPAHPLPSPQVRQGYA